MSSNARQVLIGFIPSLILPAVFMFAFIKISYNGDLTTLEVISEMFKIKKLASLLAIGAVPNLLLFFYAMHKEYWLVGRGVISATLLYGVLVMIIRMG